MKRLSPLLLAMLAFAGCRAPMPSFNLLAPYGSTRIPPPSTGSVAPDKYYQPGSPSTTPVGTGFRARRSSTSLSADASTNSSEVATVSGSDASGRATRVTHETTTVSSETVVPVTTVVESRDPIRIVESGTTARSLPPNVRGMQINESTVEPGRFHPASQLIDITQLPPASSVRHANVVPINQAVGSSAARASTSSRNRGRPASADGSGWQSRD
ncbi:MAG: hypothetical protein QGH33_05280 [Pirellulaceae bacterium]|nr:hypothetical protein [Pirellulaceae bacterium]HJN10450.1 hypothetical protein [Pirellulaceae bacterium]